MSGVLDILLIRHGETAWNAERRLQGQLDVPLNAHGERQAAALTQGLAGEALDAVYCSDLQRTRQTASGLAATRGLPLQQDASLRERCYGGFEGLLYAELEARFPAEYAAWLAREPDAPFPAGASQGETLRAFAERAVTAVLRLAEAARRDGLRRIAIVSHGGVLESVYREVHGLGHLPPRDFPIPNAGINRLRHDGTRLQIVGWAEVGHLERLAALDEIDA